MPYETYLSHNTTYQHCITIITIITTITIITIIITITIITMIAKCILLPQLPRVSSTGTVDPVVSPAMCDSCTICPPLNIYKYSTIFLMQYFQCNKDIKNTFYNICPLLNLQGFYNISNAIFSMQ